MSEKRKYDATVARIAGNIASAWPTTVNINDRTLAEFAQLAVKFARRIVGEVERTEPSNDGKEPLDRPALEAAWQLAIDRDLAQQQQIEGLQRENARLQGLLNATITTAARS